MSLNDLMSDYVARVNNAVMVNKNTVHLIKSNLVIEVSKKLVKLGYFASFEDFDRDIKAVLNVDKITKLLRISKPGCRYYCKYNNFPKIVGGKGFLLVSTSKGIKTQVEAHKEKIGGEVLFSIY